jgi:hypothetical protein
MIKILFKFFKISPINDLDITKPIHPKYLIEDVDYPFAEYGLIENNGNEDNNKMRKRVKFNLLYIFLLFNIMRAVFYLMKTKRGQKFPLYYFDITQELSSLSTLIYMITLIFYTYIARIVYLFKFSSKVSKSNQWLELLDVLKGISPINSLNISSNGSNIKLQRFFHKTKLLHQILKFLLMYLIFLYFTLSFINYLRDNGLKYLMIYGVITITLFITSTYFASMIFNYSLFYFITSCSYCETRMEIFNDRIKSFIDNNGVILNESSLETILSEHNYICNKIDNYNKFWKHYYLATTYALVPTNLVLLQQTFFEILLPYTFIAHFIVTFISVAIHFLLTYMTASVSKQCLVSYKLLHSFYVRFNDRFDKHHKLKVNQKT